MRPVESHGDAPAFAVHRMLREAAGLYVDPHMRSMLGLEESFQGFATSHDDNALGVVRIQT